MLQRVVSPFEGIEGICKAQLETCSIPVSLNSRFLCSRLNGVIFLMRNSFGMLFHNLTPILAKENNSWLVLEALTYRLPERIL